MHPFIVSHLRLQTLLRVADKATTFLTATVAARLRTLVRFLYLTVCGARPRTTTNMAPVAWYRAVGGPKRVVVAASCLAPARTGSCVLNVCRWPDLYFAHPPSTSEQCESESQIPSQNRRMLSPKTPRTRRF